MMQNKKLIVLAILGIIAILSLIRGLSVPSKIKQDIFTKDKSVPSKGVVETTIGAVSGAGATRRTNYSSWGRDPFSPFAMPIRALDGLTLNGILWDKENPIAIINNEVVKAGDKVGENVVVEIKQDRVVLSDGTRNFEISLGR